MANGQQRSDENVSTFYSWMASKTDYDFTDLAVRGQLSRQNIAAECGFARSVLVQNPRVREALKKLEDELRQRKILPPIVEQPIKEVPPSTQLNQTVTAMEHQRLKRLESENASLRAEIEQLRSAIDHYRVMESVLIETGRLPR